MDSCRTIRALTLASIVAAGLVGRAEAQQQLTIQTWAGVWEQGAKAVGEAFAKKHGVTIRYEQQQNTRMGLTRIRAQAANPQVDILMSTADALQQASDENLLVPIDRAQAPTLAELPAKAVHKASVDIMNILFGYVYRKDLAPFEMKKWGDLLDPRLKGRVASPNVQFASGRWIIMAALINGGNEQNIQPAFDFLAKMKPNISSFVATDTESIRVVQTGESAVMAFGLLSDFAKLLGPNSQLRFVIPEDKPVITNIISAAMTNPKSAALSHKFIDFLSTAESHEAYAAVLTGTPVNPKAKAPDAIKDFRPPAERLYAPDFEAINKNLAAWDDKFKKEIQTR